MDLTKKYTHSHQFSSVSDKNERRTWYVLLLTLVTMSVEVIAGTIYGSMALLADGWHMGTHAAAFCITLFTYRYARKHLHSGKFSYGTGKVGVLGGYTSAIGLGIVALIMVAESVHRLFSPLEIQFTQAIMVAVIGLIVNVASMFILGHEHHHHHHGDEHDDHGHEHGDHHHGHHHEHQHGHGHHGHDHNLKAAYLHVLADALTSLLAITALLVGKYVGWTWLDPVMGIVGAVVITKWAYGLMQQTNPILLDASISQGYQEKVVAEIEKDGLTTVTDLHIWKISADHYAASIVVVTPSKDQADDYKQALQKFGKLSHLTIEVNYC
ncbi:CDF family Co(II)/Ni(II) efflux transporter DmeF [Shewanella gelidii]|uniref:Cation efflux system protein n=1 Tax=Shewanella gelidii TaxID=1642821 RepID=A0A917JJ91_9GAMM|nr:CDF family Co(II)/Ni(II) efflux transporter DmeF [Shewanella gelidii]MCL1096973.1 CDF family Co(II)/Ni(II) efflux transporter DmeF [Shewanella gelidii]GGI71608.1 cation efflux system protein [Shewanella gelidii]